jgi:hypothetical protein
VAPTNVTNGLYPPEVLADIVIALRAAAKSVLCPPTLPIIVPNVTDNSSRISFEGFLNQSENDENGSNVSADGSGSGWYDKSISSQILYGNSNQTDDQTNLRIIELDRSNQTDNKSSLAILDVLGIVCPTDPEVYVFRNESDSDIIASLNIFAGFGVNMSYDPISGGYAVDVVTADQMDFFTALVSNFSNYSEVNFTLPEVQSILTLAEPLMQKKSAPIIWPGCLFVSSIPHGANCTAQCMPGYTPSVSALVCKLGVLTPSTYTCLPNSCKLPSPYELQVEVEDFSNGTTTEPASGWFQQVDAFNRSKWWYVEKQNKTTEYRTMLVPRCKEGIRNVSHGGGCTTECLSGLKEDKEGALNSWNVCRVLHKLGASFAQLVV